jgi:hypothetical protein
VLHAAQYADDAEPFLRSLSQLPAFIACMNTFAEASGQHLNLSKTHVVLLGRQRQRPPIQPQLPEGLSLAQSAKSLGVTFSGTGDTTIDWGARMAIAKHRLGKIAHIPNLSAFGRAFAVNAYALATLLYAGQFGCGMPTLHAEKLQKWSAAVVDASLSPEGSLSRPPGVPSSCMAAHPKEGGFGLIPLNLHLWSRWACEARDLLIGASNAPWIALAKALWREWSQQQEPRVRAGGSSIWGLLLCARSCLFADVPGQALLPQPLRCLATGMRALPPLSHVDEEPLDITELCWGAPLWSNPVFTAMQHWDWQGQQREVAVGLECVAPLGLLNLPMLQTLGQAVTLQHELQRVCASHSLAAHAAYRIVVHRLYLQSQPAYMNQHLALTDVSTLLDLLPEQWVEAATNRLTDALNRGRSAADLMSTADMAAARSSLSAHLGWHLHSSPNPITLPQLTVALATRLQQSPTLEAIAERHSVFTAAAAALEQLTPLTQLPAVPSVLRRWWALKVANIYKESAWRLTLNAFPTAQRMHLSTPCPACGLAAPGFQHLFWMCPVADAVRSEIERQLIACHMLEIPRRLACADIWLARLPNPSLHRIVWDLVCLAAIHAMDVGRRAAWAVGQRLPSPTLVTRIAARAACGALWTALADFAATIKVPTADRTTLLTKQPFIAWHVVLLAGNGMRVVQL